MSTILQHTPAAFISGKASIPPLIAVSTPHTRITVQNGIKIKFEIGETIEISSKNINDAGKITADTQQDAIKDFIYFFRGFPCLSSIILVITGAMPPIPITPVTESTNDASLTTKGFPAVSNITAIPNEFIRSERRSTRLAP